MTKETQQKPCESDRQQQRLLNFAPHLTVDITLAVETLNQQQIILFGSYAYGQPRPDSDLDLLVIMSHAGRNTDVAMAIWQATRPNFPVDLIVRSPDEVIWRYREYDLLIRMVLDKGTVLYDQRHSRVTL